MGGASSLVRVQVQLQVKVSVGMSVSVNEEHYLIQEVTRLRRTRLSFYTSSSCGTVRDVGRAGTIGSWIYDSYVTLLRACTSQADRS